MPKYEHILASISSNNWAITKDGIRTILAIAQQGPEALEMKKGFDALKITNQNQFTASGRSSYKGNVATLDLQGPIFPKANMMTDFSGATSLEGFMKDFAAAEVDDDITDIVLYTDTPGGVVTGIAEAGQMIASSSKKVTAYVTGSAASAGYWLASQANKIVVSPTAYVGSIGVVTSRYRTSKEDKTIEFVSSQSPKKRINPETKEGAADIVAELDQIAEVFISTVAEGRDVDEKTVLKDFGKGGGLIGQYAVDAGMADSVGTYEELLAELNTNQKEGGSEMPDVKDLTASDIEKGNPELYKSIVESGRKAGADESSEAIATLKSENDDLKTKLAKSDEDASAMDTRMKTLEKNEAKRQVQDIQTSASSVVSTALAASNIPKAFHSKVAAHMDADSHIVEGALDTEAFAASVEAEIKDWSASFASTSSTHGMSTADDDNNDLDNEDTDATVGNMLAHCGIEEDK